MGIQAVILAAGQGKRMKSKQYKVLHPVCGKAMVGHIVDAAGGAGADSIVVVVGHGAEAVQEYLDSRAAYARQNEQLGTGHAVMQAADQLQHHDGITLVLYGDTPLIRAETLRRLVEHHQAGGAAATLLTAMVDEPTGYGRIIRTADGKVAGIVEEKDCTPDQRAVREINPGFYCFDNRKLWAALAEIKNDNAQGEYYLTDVIGVLREQGDTVDAVAVEDAEETLGVNDRVALSEAERIMRRRILRGHMLNGVTIVDPANTYVEAEVRIGQDTVLLPGCLLQGRTEIGEDCRIGPNADIRDCRIGDGVHIRQSVLTEAQVEHEAAVGPYAYLRPGAKIGPSVKIGDFVEIKNARIGENTKISHLSYVGDAEVGRDVNIGCGAITVNYDGYNKQVTQIEDEAFVGSNVNLIAPVKIGKGAYVVAGSTVTHDVGENDLAIARERQVNKAGYADKLRKRFKAKKEQGKP